MARHLHQPLEGEVDQHGASQREVRVLVLGLPDWSSSRRSSKSSAISVTGLDGTTRD